MSDSRISDLPSSATLTGAEAIPIDQSSVTVKTTLQDVANLVTVENIGNTDLTSTDDERVINLINNTFSKKLTVSNSLGNDCLQVTGDLKVGLGGAADSFRTARTYGTHQIDNLLYVGSSENLILSGNTTNRAIYGTTALGRHQFKNNSAVSFFEIYPAGSQLNTTADTLHFTDTGESSIKIGGNLSTDSLTIKNNSGTNIASFQGNKDVVFSGNIGHGVSSVSSIHYRLQNTGSEQYGFYSSGDPTQAHYIANNTAKKGFISSSVQNSGIGFVSESTITSGSNTMFFADIQSGGTTDVECFAAKAPVSGSLTGGNFKGFISKFKNGNANSTGIELDISGSTGNNYAIDIISGDINTSGGVGLSATYTFGGGGSGDIASMTFTNGILTATTTV